jgi:hypothetical protein
METNSVMENAGAIVPVKPEWLRISDACRVSGLGRSLLYQHLKAGRIKSVCLRQRNKVRGIRLVNTDSLRSFIESFTNEPAIK